MVTIVVGITISVINCRIISVVIMVVIIDYIDIISVEITVIMSCSVRWIVVTNPGSDYKRSMPVTIVKGIITPMVAAIVGIIPSCTIIERIIPGHTVVHSCIKPASIDRNTP